MMTNTVSEIGKLLIKSDSWFLMPDPVELKQFQVRRALILTINLWILMDRRCVLMDRRCVLIKRWCVLTGRSRDIGSPQGMPMLAKGRPR